VFDSRNRISYSKFTDVTDASECGERHRYENGSCIECEDYERATNDNYQCGADTCSSDEFLRVDGKCEKCPSCTNPDSTGKWCIPEDNCSKDKKECNDDQIVTNLNTCYDCLGFTVPDAKKRSCIYA
jgi:hypothetical protein